MKIPLRQRLAELLPGVRFSRAKTIFQFYLEYRHRTLLEGKHDDQFAANIRAYKEKSEQQGVDLDSFPDLPVWWKAEKSRKRAESGKRGGHQKQINKEDEKSKVAISKPARPGSEEIMDSNASTEFDYDSIDRALSGQEEL